MSGRSVVAGGGGCAPKLPWLAVYQVGPYGFDPRVTVCGVTYVFPGRPGWAEAVVERAVRRAPYGTEATLQEVTLNPDDPGEYLTLGPVWRAVYDPVTCRVLWIGGSR